MAEGPSVWRAVWHRDDERWDLFPSDAVVERAFTAAPHHDGSLAVVGLTEQGAVSRLASAGAGWDVRESMELPGVTFPCRVRFDEQRNRLLVAGYGNGALAVIDLDDDGAFAGEARTFAFTGTGPDPDRQEGPHGHDVIVLDEGIGVIDLGADVLRILDPESLAETGVVAFPPGSGPRHVVDLGDGRIVVSGELDSTLILASVPERRVLDVIPSTAHTGEPRNYPSTVILDAARGIVHLANRGADTVLTARVHADRLELLAETPSGGGAPQHLALDDQHLLAVHSDDGAVVALRLDDGVPTGAVADTARIPGAYWIEPLPPRG
jgi:6-phosphogluconolactonase (cycloisomerase 2 family)